MESDNESGLVTRAAKGDTEAFRRLFEAHHAAMFRFAYHLTGAVDVAEDITQECFVRLMQHPGFEAHRGSLRRHLYGMVRNLVRQYQHANGCEVNWEDDTRCTAASPPALLASSQLSSVVQAAISELPPLQREAIVLCELQELPLDEAAAIADTDVGTFKSRLHRAREGLRRRLAACRTSLLRGSSL